MSKKNYSIIYVIIILTISLSIIPVYTYNNANNKNYLIAFRNMYTNPKPIPVQRYETTLIIDNSSYIGLFGKYGGVNYYDFLTTYYLYPSMRSIDGETCALDNNYEYVSWLLKNPTKAALINSIKKDKVTIIVVKLDLVKPLKLCNPYMRTCFYEYGYNYMITYDLQNREQHITPYDLPWMYNTNYPDNSEKAVLIIIHPISGIYNGMKPYYDTLLDWAIYRRDRAYLGFYSDPMWYCYVNGCSTSTFNSRLEKDLDLISIFIHDVYQHLVYDKDTLANAVAKAYNTGILQSGDIIYVLAGDCNIRLVK